ncbi:unnamed protein product [Caenorhabditis brenneri]
MDSVYDRETLRGFLYCTFTQGNGEVQAHKALTDAAGEEALTLDQVREIYADFRKNPKKIKKEMRDSIKAAGGLSLEYVKDFYKKIENGEWTLKVGQGTSKS